MYNTSHHSITTSQPYDFVNSLKLLDYTPRTVVPKTVTFNDVSKTRIFRYLHAHDYESSRPYSYTRTYGNTSYYTPPTMAAESSRMTKSRSYSGYTYVGAEHSYDIASRPRSLTDYHFWRSHVASSPWYWTYYGNSGLRHYNSYRPRAYTSRLSTYWTPYF
ncbi:unnamed protein product [Anisakis simplex]|uniref:Uncharacterized protein n=1 Tax=Anisakis simplex TaxID=6269 RepID=A0A0M3KCZ5_ANISI|nr:unnamed protein product [Anisakis simplex]